MFRKLIFNIFYKPCKSFSPNMFRFDLMISNSQYEKLYFFFKELNSLNENRIKL